MVEEGSLVEGEEEGLDLELGMEFEEFVLELLKGAGLLREGEVGVELYEEVEVEACRVVESGARREVLTGGLYRAERCRRWRERERRDIV